MDPLIGRTLSHYRIVEKIGAGGMGEVYRAHDSRLGRDVAIKVLPPHLSATPEVRARFEREARTISQLNHPHICTLHDVGHEDGVDYLVMELVAGESLAQRLQKGPLPMADVLRIGAQIADALDRAHRAGVIHRDLKPGNVMLAKSGAKLMDFGLARTSAPIQQVSAPAESPTMSRSLTAEGTILGTLQYMAPEQLEGKEADERSDLWGLGCVLYEMATGRCAFEGKSQASLITSIMGGEPPGISQLAPLAPPGLERLVHACLAKDPADRLQSAHDIRIQLAWLAGGGSQAGVPMFVAERRKNRERLAWIVAGASTLALAVGAALVGPRIMRSPIPPPVMRLSVTVPPEVRLANEVTNSVISPDGSLLAIVASDSSGTPHIWLRPSGSLAAQPLVGTDNPYFPFWSPDSRTLGFFADGKLKKVAVADGALEVICDAPDARGGTWNRDDEILFAPVAMGGLSRVAAQGGEPAEILRPDSTRGETGLRWPRFLPDGRHFLFLSLPAGRGGDHPIYVGKLGSSERESLLVSATAPVYAEPGFLILVRNGRLLAQRFDAAMCKATGRAIPLGDAPTLSQVIGAPAVSVSSNGILAHTAAGIRNTELVWMDRDGKLQGTVTLPPGRYFGQSLSPDNRRVVVERQSSASQVDLWMVEIARGIATRFTFSSAPASAGSMNPIWSPDGRWVAFNETSSGSNDIYRKLVNGAGDEEPLLVSSAPFKNPYQWSWDGRYIVFSQPDPVTGWDLWLLPVEGERKPIPILKSRFNEESGQISPDGRWISYISDESGRYEVYVQSFPKPESKYQVTNTGAGFSVWSKDGTKMLITGLDGTFLSVDVQAGASFRASTPRVLFKPRQDALTWTVTSDLQRFLLAVPVGATAPNSVTLVLNWMSALPRT